MIVTTGKIIKVEVYSSDVFRYVLERDSETPGVVTVHVMRSRGDHVASSVFELPANEQAAAEFIRSYQRIIAEDVGYRKRENE